MGYKSDPRAKLILEVIGVTFLGLILSLSLGIIFSISLDFLGYDPDSIFVILSSTILAQIGFLILAYLYIRKKRIIAPIAFPSRTDLKYIGWGTTLALIIAIGLQMFLVIFDLVPESALEEIAATHPNILLVLAFLSVVLIAPAEELLFRGAIQGRLREGLSSRSAVIIASVLFGALHIGNYVGELLPILLAVSIIVIVSVILGAIYEKSKNLVVPISIHAIYNVVLLLMSYAAL